MQTKNLFLMLISLGIVTLYLYFDYSRSQRQIHEIQSSVKHMEPERVLALYQLMKDAHEIFEKNDIEYWVQGGTLLGAIRHKGLLRWDDDLDVNIDISQEEKLVSLAPEFEKAGYGFLNCYPQNSWLYKIYGLNDRMLVLDIFLTLRQQDKVVYKYHWFKRDGEPIYVTLDELYPLKLYPFGEILVYGPNNPIPYLDASFGTDWPTIAYKFNHFSKNREKVILQAKDKVPAQPTGPLKNKIDPLLPNGKVYTAERSGKLKI